MKARRYSPADFDQISQWAKDGYETSYEADQFPEIGFIVDGYAAYFLYQTDSKICFCENLISNRFADEFGRRKAVTLVIDAVLAEAQRLGFKIAYATTGNSSVILRAVQLGAIAVPRQSLLIKTLATPNDGSATA